ncbi:MAG: ParA family protein [Cyclobacteriaceae bacterium]|nr:ParA family protein [Cyclobacteriaceae bacterium]MCH8515862.1 ParA family protein [Cyclobacteriaceae bacterium]
MAKVISFISRKGGTGKTTNAINLATMLANLGYTPLLVETDTNFTLSTLRQMEEHQSKANKKSLFQIIGAEEDELQQKMDQLKADDRIDYLIIDSAGKTTDVNIKKLCVASDLVIVPTSLTQNDLLVTYQTLEDIKPAKEKNPNLVIAVLPNRIHSSTKKNTVLKQLEELDAQVIQSFVPMKNLYANFSTILPEKEYLKQAKEIIGIIPQ